MRLEFADNPFFIHGLCRLKTPVCRFGVTGPFAIHECVTAKRELKSSEKVLAYGVVILILLVFLSPHIGLLLLSFGTIWSFAPLPDAYTLQNYVTMWEGSKTYILNTFLYAGIAATLDVMIGTAIAYIVIRTGIFGRKWLDYLATAALAVPALSSVLAIYAPSTVLMCLFQANLWQAGGSLSLWH